MAKPPFLSAPKAPKAPKAPSSPKSSARMSAGKAAPFGGKKAAPFGGKGGAMPRPVGPMGSGTGNNPPAFKKGGRSC